jgi:glycolate oxidase
MVCDGTVPRTKLPEVLSKVLEIGRTYDLLIGNVFHAGDGNLHPLILFDERNEEEMERVRKASTEILKICADVGGTISGEHGIGIEKLKEMSFIFSESDFKAMRRVKQAFDPAGLMNPGKVIPE